MGQISNVAVGLIGGALFGALSGGAALWLLTRLFGRGMAAFQLGVEEEARIGALLGAIFGLVTGAVAGAVSRAGGGRLGGALAGAACGLALAVWPLYVGGGGLSGDRAAGMLRLALVVVPLGGLVGLVVATALARPGGAAGE